LSPRVHWWAGLTTYARPHIITGDTLMPAVAHATARPGQGLTIGLWIAQVLLFAAFGMAGLVKSTTPLGQLAGMMPWTTAVPGGLVRFIGIAELAGAIGVLLPAVSRVRPGLTPLAALGLLTVMVLASLFHLSRGEASVLPVNAALGGLAAFVAWGRSRRAPISARA
jgi:putative oxidoreductase